MLNKISFRYIKPTKNTRITCAFEFARKMHDMGLKPPTGVAGAIWFRGQSDAKWPLVPGIGRKHDDFGEKNVIKKRDLLKLEYEFLHRFRRYAHALKQEQLTPWEAITMAQHHGLPTRLIDWTSSPLVALYFTCLNHVSDKEREDGAVYFFRLRKKRNDLNIYEKRPRQVHEANPLKVKGIKIVYSMMSTARIAEQSGGFTIQDPCFTLDEQAGKRFDKKNLDISDLHKWIVPGEKKAEIMSQLERVGINPRTLFPDLDGIVAGILHTEFFRKKD